MIKITSETNKTCNSYKLYDINEAERLFRARLWSQNMNPSRAEVISLKDSTIRLTTFLNFGTILIVFHTSYYIPLILVSPANNYIACSYIIPETRHWRWYDQSHLYLRQLSAFHYSFTGGGMSRKLHHQTKYSQEKKSVLRKLLHLWSKLKKLTYKFLIYFMDILSIFIFKLSLYIY